MAQTAVGADLRVAAASAELVRVRRTIRGADVIEGFILKIGAEWLLRHKLDPGIFLDGHIALRVRDVQNVRPLANATFVARALQHLGMRPRMPGRVDLTSARTVIETASRRFPLLTIHVERRNPDVCYIGAAVDMSSRTLRLREITPTAAWEDKPTNYALRDITRVDIGSHYERALLAVGGVPRT